MKRLFCGGKVVSAKEVRQADVLIEDGIIVRIDKHIDDADAEIVDVTGKYLFPGFIDGHTHMDLEVSDTVTADGFDTGTKAELAGEQRALLILQLKIRAKALSLR